MGTDSHRSVDYRKKAVPETLWRRTLDRARDQLYERFARHFPPRRETSVVNIGANGSYDRPELHTLESRYPFPESIVACGLEPPDNFERCYPNTRYQQIARGEPLPFDDDEFDVVFSNAVVEHVGDRRQQRRFIEEVLRIARAAFITTPNRWFPVELHVMLPLLHWLPASIYRPAYRKLGFEFFSREENLNLLDKSDFAALVPDTVDATIETHRFFGMPSNLILVVKDRGPRAPR